MTTIKFPTILVIFGATGDLMARKIAPALFHLYERDLLPQMLQIVGFARRDLGEKGFREHVRKILLQHPDIKKNNSKLDDFLRHITYRRGDFKNLADFKRLSVRLGLVDKRWQVCANKLFYLAVPPAMIKDIVSHIDKTGLAKPCSAEEGWTRVLVEKPFGKDLASAEELDILLSRLFKEEQIYRIDHYLAKEMLQNILAFRFSNNLLEQSWNNKFIESIEISILESIGVEDRGAFYDGVGALRDFGQNHLLQILALLTIEHPLDDRAETIRSARAKLLAQLTKPQASEIKNCSYRGQYEGYLKQEGVSKNSQTETYFRLRAQIDNNRWRGVPIYLETGKAMPRAQKRIIVNFKHPSPCLYCPVGLTNKVVFQLEPREKITIHFWSKKPGFSRQVTEKTFNFFNHKKPHEEIEDYSKILLDCFSGDQTLFVSTKEVKVMWSFIDPIKAVWDKNLVPMKIYSSQSDKALLEARAHCKSEGKKLKKEIGIIGLGKMGKNHALRLVEKGWKVVGLSPIKSERQAVAKNAVITVKTIKDMAKRLSTPRIIWLMIPSGAVESVLFDKEGILDILESGDIVIDGGNSKYSLAKNRAKKLNERKIKFLDVGVSGGPAGARQGACLMIGGNYSTFDYLEPLFADLASPGGYQFFNGLGAGHFVKMVHNGIEYGMMQAIGEGFAIMKKSGFDLDLSAVARIYQRGSVIESRLIGYLEDAFRSHTTALSGVSGEVAHTGEGQWSVEYAKSVGVNAKVLEDAFLFRVHSKDNPSYTGKIVSALREQFGGHNVNKKINNKNGRKKA